MAKRRRLGDHCSKRSATSRRRRLRLWPQPLIGNGDAIRLACTSNLAGIEIPLEEGGLGLPFAFRAQAAEILAGVDFAYAFAFINHHNAILRIAEHGSAAARRKYVRPMLRGELIGCTAMSEPDAGKRFFGYPDAGAKSRFRVAAQRPQAVDCCCRPDGPRTNRSKAELHDPGAEIEELLLTKLTSLGDRPRVVYHDANWGNIKSLVGAGFGVSLVTESDVGTSPSGLIYRELRDGTGPSRVGYSAHWRADNDNPVLASFLKILGERYRSPAV